jgi:rod shape-determining protein MreB
MELRALRAAFEAAGARDVILVNRAIAAALGAGLSVDQPEAQMVVDLGAGSFEVAMVCDNRVAHHRTLHGGGDAMTLAIVDAIRHDHALHISQSSAQHLKHSLGAAGEAEATSARVAGRCLKRGIPRATEVVADEVCRAIGPRVDAISRAIVDVMADAGPARQSEIYRRGVVLTGGGSDLRNLAGVLRRRTGLPVLVAPNAAHAVVRGAGRVLEELEIQRAVAC